MKSIKVSAFAAIIFIAATACKKSESTNIALPAANREATLETTSMQRPSWGVWYVWNGVNKCVSPKVNCFDEIIVRPKRIQEDPMVIYQGEFEEAINSGPPAIAAFFSSGGHGLNLFPELNNPDENVAYYNKLVSGNYQIDIVTNGNVSNYLVKQTGLAEVDFVLVINNHEES